MTGTRPGLWLPLAAAAFQHSRRLQHAVPISMKGDGLTLYSCPAYQKLDGQKWAGLSNRPRLKDGQQVIGADGKPAYDTVVEFSTRQHNDRFSDAAVAVIEARHPHAFDDGEGLP